MDFQLCSHSSLNKRVFIQRDHRMLQLLLWYQAKDFKLWQRPIINNFVTIWVDRHKRKRLKLWTVTLMKTYIVFAAKNQEIIASWFLIKYMDVVYVCLFTFHRFTLAIEVEDRISSIWDCIQMGINLLWSSHDIPCSLLLFCFERRLFPRYGMLYGH